MRNLRAKTVKQTIVAAVTEENTATVNTTANTSAESIELEKENVSNVTVFPVKTSLRSQVVDKENVAPLVSKATAATPVDWDDLDTEDQGDPLMVSDYVVEIFEYMRSLEVSPANKESFSSLSLCRNQSCPDPIIWFIKRNWNGICVLFWLIG